MSQDDTTQSEPHVAGAEAALHVDAQREPAIPAVQIDEAEVKVRLKGMDHFRAARWNEALAAYRSGLGHLPKRRTKEASLADKGKQKENLDDLDAEETVDLAEGASTSQDTNVLTEPEPTPLETECVKARAVLNANIGACHVKLGEHKEVVVACTESLKDDPNYIKALQRRAASNNVLDTWSSLTSAQEDYNKLLTLLPSSSTQVVEIRRTLQAIKPRLEAAQKRETAEMVDKLKGLGNNLLGHFGLSTDNFQFVPNGQGGYSMNFVR
ncbi:hypothetical protein NM688_g2517 [Phlebia brevispora]|uniref:Uncharacterized protein n=1 Tax=Phlebia brevispora TaxID=194682 RepID=A0ACC1T840_9APHY|nr:hypothetical protein NM688_g2517 [Phlebia brevispora]